MSVGVVERRVLAPLRDRTFFSLGELNAAIAEGVAALCAEPFQKREGSRDSVFEEVERPLLQPLPAARYEMAERRGATVAFNYHVSFDGRYYSVPFSLVRRRVEVSATRNLAHHMSIAERRGGALLEEACAKALVYSPRPSYKTVKEIASALAESTPADGSV